MAAEWIVIETLAILVENLSIVYFLNSRYPSKRESFIPQLLVWFVLCAIGFTAIFLGFLAWGYDVFGTVALLVYLGLSKRGAFLYKAFGVIIAHAVIISSSMLGTGLVSLLADVSLTHTLLNQDRLRLLALLLIKAMQVVLFYTLARRPANYWSVKRKTVMLFSVIILIIFVCMAIIVFSVINDYDSAMNSVLAWLAAGLLCLMISAFFLLEMFEHEESSNLDMSTRLQRFEMERHYFEEIDVVYTDLRRWRHEYSNNLIALRALIEHGESDNALEYIDSISAKHRHEGDTLQTGNLILDAVVSTKLWFARSHDIEVSVHALYPESNNIEANDLCAIAGNLLDNAIEACLRMTNQPNERFIKFELLPKGKALSLSISNSYDGSLKIEGNRYITVKDKRIHGIGIEYVDSIVEKYQGQVLREHDGGVFVTNIMLPLLPAVDTK